MRPAAAVALPTAATFSASDRCKSIPLSAARATNAWTVLVDKEQRVWAGTRDEGLFQLQENRFQPAPGAKILGQKIFALFEDRGGQLWVGAQNGLGCWNGRNWKLFTTRDGLSENTVRAGKNKDAT